jgi:hypothetical protein
MQGRPVLADPFSMLCHGGWIGTEGSDDVCIFHVAVFDDPNHRHLVRLEVSFWLADDYVDDRIRFG